MRLASKVAIVTGGASGFGAATVRRFVEEGAKVVIADMNLEGAQEVAESIGASVIAVQVDVTNREDVESAVAQAVSQFGGLDIYINNAGYSHLNIPMLEVDESTFDRTFEVNVKAIYLAAQAAVPALRVSGKSAFITVCSTAGVRPRPGMTWYAGSKAAAISLSKGMALELASAGIRVNALCPVAGDTPMLARFLPGPDTPETRQMFIDSIPLSRLCKPEDVANAALYLASDEAEFITGVAMEVDGGRCI